MTIPASERPTRLLGNYKLPERAEAKDRTWLQNGSRTYLRPALLLDWNAAVPILVSVLHFSSPETGGEHSTPKRKERKVCHENCMPASRVCIINLSTFSNLCTCVGLTFELSKSPALHLNFFHMIASLSRRAIQFDQGTTNNCEGWESSASLTPHLSKTQSSINYRGSRS